MRHLVAYDPVKEGSFSLHIKGTLVPCNYSVIIIYSSWIPPQLLDIQVIKM